MNPELSYGEKPAGAEAAPQNFFSRLIGVFSPLAKPLREWRQRPARLCR